MSLNEEYNVSPVMSELYVFSKNDNIAHMNRKGAKTLVHYPC